MMSKKPLSESARSALKKCLNSIISAIAGCLLALFGGSLVSSCGSITRARVMNNRENTQTTITISTNTSASPEVNVSPNTNIKDGN